MSEHEWKTGITKIEPNKISVRGYPVDKLMGAVTFSQAIYLVLKGELPSPEVGRLLDAVFVSSIDHGAGPPSVLAARTVASTGSELNACVAGGILAISRYHGGAIENGMKMFQKIAERMERDAIDAGKAAGSVLQEMKSRGERASGFGHRIHTKDPRTSRLFNLARELGLAGKHVDIAETVEKTLAEALGKKLPINVDGAIAALLCDLGFPAEVGNAFFIIPRTAGLVAHIREENTRMKPMRKIHPTGYVYDGPEDREL
ncbi:MAG: citryl-CoA lyase [Candidatus Aminicenantes bacterium]|nr:citryl-CoA lyase [Candidatus Aminicenantes bacterium]